MVSLFLWSGGFVPVFKTSEHTHKSQMDGEFLSYCICLLKFTLCHFIKLLKLKSNRSSARHSVWHHLRQTKRAQCDKINYPQRHIRKLFSFSLCFPFPSLSLSLSLWRTLTWWQRKLFVCITFNREYHTHSLAHTRNTKYFATSYVCIYHICVTKVAA